MKTILSLLSVALLFSGPENGFSQGTFVNLDFAHPVTPLTRGLVPATNAIPGWTAYAYGPASFIGYNTLSLGSALVSLQGPGSLSPIIQGSYTVYLQGEFAGPHSAAVGQVGQIPLGTQSLLFWGYVGLDTVSFGGQILPLTVTATTPNHNVYGADVSAFAGQSGELLFTSPPGFFELLDNIQFSTLPVPEPSIFAFFALGSLLLGFNRWRRK